MMHVNPYKSRFDFMFDREEKEEKYGKLGGEIKVWKDPYEMGFPTTKKRKIKFEPGVTVLVGCNGSGKTTLLRNIKEVCRNAHCAYLEFDNLQSGGTNAVSAAGYDGDYAVMSMLWSASEGEAITLNVGRFAQGVGNTLRNDYASAEEVWLLFDATDSGLSIDNVLDIKLFFDAVLEENTHRDVYIIISANEYELAAGSRCLDVMTGKTRTFKTYASFKKFILECRKKKDARNGMVQDDEEGQEQ